jgi:mannose-6-phosphate isomerase
LEGQNIELMANSDNVLRGGLTPKYVDSKELIQQVNFEPTYPVILKGERINQQETNYPCATADFGLTKIALEVGESYIISSHSMEMLLAMEGTVLVDHLTLKSGDSVVIAPDSKIELIALQPTVLFRSFVPE